MSGADAETPLAAELVLDNDQQKALDKLVEDAALKEAEKQKNRVAGRLLSMKKYREAHKGGSASTAAEPQVCPVQQQAQPGAPVQARPAEIHETPAHHTSIREATFTLGVGSKGITWVTEWAPLGSLSEGEHTVWAFGQSLSNGVGARPITLLAVIESGDTCRTTQRTVSTVNLHSEVDSELTQLLLLIQIRQKVH